MNLRQGRTLLAFYAVDVFLDAYQARLPKTTASGARKQFARTLAELALHVQTQAGAPITAQGLTAAKAKQREALVRDYLAPIAKIAKLESEAQPPLKALKRLRGEPALQKLLAHAAGMAVIAQDYRDVFVAAGMRPTFIEDMTESIDSIMNTVTARTERVGAASGATKGLEATLAKGMKQKRVLDSFIRTELKDDLTLLAAWRTVQRVEGLPGRRKRQGRSRVECGRRPSWATPADLPLREPSRLLSAPGQV